MARAGQCETALPVYVAIEGYEPDRLNDSLLLDKLDRLQAEVEQDPMAGGSLSLAEYVKRMHRIMNEDRPEMEVIPTSQDLVAQYLLLYSFSGDPDDFDEVVDYDYQLSAKVEFSAKLQLIALVSAPISGLGSHL